MAAKRTSKKGGVWLQQTDLSLCLAAIFATLSFVFLVVAYVQYY